MLRRQNINQQNPKKAKLKTCDLSKSSAEYFVKQASLGKPRQVHYVAHQLIYYLLFLSTPHTGQTIDSLPSVSSSEVLKLLHKSPPKSSFMDTIQISLLLECHHSFSEIIVHLANMSFTDGKFPSRFKTASVTPLLKNPSLDLLVIDLFQI